MTVYTVPWFLDRAAREPELLAGGPAETITAQPGTGDQLESLAPLHRNIAAAVARDKSQNAVPVLALGDCCQTIPVVAGLAHSAIHPTLLWFDSHGDFNTWETTPSKFLGGMPLAMLTGRGDQRMLSALELAPMRDEQVVLVDARDLDPGERRLVEGSSIRHLKEVEEVVDYSLPKGPLYVHVDTDILDARKAPAFLYPVPGGPALEDLETVLAYLKSTGQVVAWSVTAAWDSTRQGAAETLAASRRLWQAIVD